VVDRSKLTQLLADKVRNGEDLKAFVASLWAYRGGHNNDIRTLLEGVGLDESARFDLRNNGYRLVLESEDGKFTGVITDKIGRKYHYVNGERVSQNHHDTHVKSGGKSQEYHHYNPLQTPFAADELVRTGVLKGLGKVAPPAKPDKDFTGEHGGNFFVKGRQIHPDMYKRAMAGPNAPKLSERHKSKNMLESLHSYASTQFDLDNAGYSRSQGNPVDKLKFMMGRIAPEDISKPTATNAPHLTVKYGIHGYVSPEQVKKVVKGFGPITATLGKTSIFPADSSAVEQGNDAHDVVKVDVHSPQLHVLNQLLADSLPHTDAFPTYCPHVTLAYCHPGYGGKYADMTDVEGMEMMLHELAFCDADGNRHIICLVDDDAPVRGDSGRIPLPMRVKRDAFLYMEPTQDCPDFAQCSSCVFWTDSSRSRCALIGGEVEATGDSACDLYVTGCPDPAQEVRQLVTVQEVGFVHRQVRCANCLHFEPDRCECDLYGHLNRDQPDRWDLDVKVHAQGCCNAQTPKPQVTQMAESAVLEGYNPVSDIQKAGKFLQQHKLKYPDYGQIFIKENGSGEAWYVGSDSDEQPLYDLVKKTLMKIKGIDEVTCKAEGFPPENEGWVQVYPPKKSGKVQEAAEGSMSGDTANINGQAKLWESLERLLVESGFTGIDKRGHKWVNGRQVKRTDLGGVGTNAHTPDTKSAQHRVKQLPDYGYGLKKPPFPYHRLLAESEAKVDEKALKDAPPIEVPMSSLASSQDNIDPKDVEKHIAAPQGPLENVSSAFEYPTAVYKNGKYVLFDGHHRAVGAWARGDKTLLVRLIKFDPTQGADGVLVPDTESPAPRSHGPHHDVLSGIDHHTLSNILSIGKRVLSGALHLPHAGKDFIVRQVNKLPALLRIPVVGVFTTAYVSYIKAQELVAARLESEGASQERMENIASALVFADTTLAKFIGSSVGTTVGIATGSPALGTAAGFAASFVPVASLAYLAFSKAPNPLQVLRSAQKRISAALGQKATQEAMEALELAVQERLATGGFTGVITDSIGREYHYLNGEKVASRHHAAHVAKGGRSDQYHHSDEIATEHEADAHAARIGGTAVHTLSPTLPEPAQGPDTQVLPGAAKQPILPTDQWQKLAEQWMPLAYKLSNKWHRAYGGDKDDLDSAAQFALVRAAQHYDPNYLNPANGKPFEFSTVATHYIKRQFQYDARQRGVHNVKADLSFNADKNLDAEDRSKSTPSSGMVAKELSDIMDEVLTDQEKQILKAMISDKVSSTVLGQQFGKSAARIRQIRDDALEKVKAKVSANTHESLVRECRESAESPPVDANPSPKKKHREIVRNADGSIKEVIEWED
jgi:RNA polymerase sigma factor (sigma-70 family)